MGWTGGYVLLALLLAPYLRKFGKFTVPDFVGDRYYSQLARVVAVICAIFVSFTYVAGQMRGVGVVFSRFLEVEIHYGVMIGLAIVFFYAVLGGMKGITYTQVAQYVILIFAFMVPAIFISIMLTGNPIPQLGFGGTLEPEFAPNGVDTMYLLERLNGLHQELGFARYTSGTKSTLDVFCITMALMVGTAGLPHVIIRFYTVPKVRDARLSAGYALLFIAILYTTAPAVAAFARTNLITEVEGAHYTAPENAEPDSVETVPEWFKTYEDTGLLAWQDKNEDGRIQYYAGQAFIGTPEFKYGVDGEVVRAVGGQRVLQNKPTDTRNELYIDRDIMVLANPEIAQLPAWVIALVAAGALAAALSTAAGLLLVVSSAISHDLLKKTFMPDISDKGELIAARISAAVAVCIAGYFGINPPGFVAEVVAFAFGLAASTFFPAILLGIFSKRANREGVVAGMIIGLLATSSYIVYFKFLGGTSDQWLFGISPEGFGAVGMFINFAVALVVSFSTKPPPEEVQEMVEEIRVPRGAEAPADVH
jgi:cation/acetate symporter